jgi:hypothetical protein
MNYKGADEPSRIFITALIIVKNIIKMSNKERFYAAICRGVENRLARKLSDHDISIICKFMEKGGAEMKTEPEILITALSNTIMNNNAAGRDGIVNAATRTGLMPMSAATAMVDDPLAAHKHNMGILNEDANPIQPKEKLPIENADLRNMTKYLSFKMDNDLLRTQFITQYLALDNYYLADLSALAVTGGFFTNVMSFQMSANDMSNTNRTITLKTPLSDIIRFDIQPFTIPYYGVYTGLASATYNGYALVRSPPGKLIQIIVPEIIETYKSTAAQNYMTLAKIQYDTTTYDGTNLPLTSTITPNNSSIFTFRYPLKYLTTVSVRLNDMLRDILLPTPFLYSNTITKANPTIITVSTTGNPVGTFFAGGERVYISGFTSTSAAADATLVSEFNTAEGLIVTQQADRYQFSVPIDSSAMAGSPAAIFTIFVACRRIVIPVTIQQLRPEISCEIN